MVPFVFTLATQLEPCRLPLCHNGVINNVEAERKTGSRVREGACLLHNVCQTININETRDVCYYVLLSEMRRMISILHLCSKNRAGDRTCLVFASVFFMYGLNKRDSACELDSFKVDDRCVLAAGRASSLDANGSLN